MDNKDDKKKNIQIRLRRIEGQVKGIEKMMDKDACCKELLVQIAAIRAAINKVGGMILEGYAKDCMTSNEIDKDNEKSIEDLILTLMMFIK